MKKVKANAKGEACTAKIKFRVYIEEMVQMYVKIKEIKDDTEFF